MPARYLLDTDTCIYIIKQKPASVRARFSQYAASDIAICAITWGELQFGWQGSQQREKARVALDQFRVLIAVEDLSGEAGRHYGQIRHALKIQGRMIGNNDLWIAAHAHATGAILVTNNVREFSRVPDLEIENWV